MKPDSPLPRSQARHLFPIPEAPSVTSLQIKFHPQKQEKPMYA